MRKKILKRAGRNSIGGLLTREPESWVCDSNNKQVLAVFHKSKIKNEVSALSRLSPLKTMLSLGKLYQPVFSHLFRLMYCARLIKTGFRVLDVGCGESELREFLYRNMCQVEYVGIDLSRRSLESALQKVSSREYLYLQLDINGGIPFKDCSFDVVVFTEVIEHISKGKGKYVLSECRRLLKEGGKLYISTPDDVYASDSDRARHIYQYTQVEIECLLKQTGFKINSIQGNGINAKQLKLLLSKTEMCMYKQMLQFVPREVLLVAFSQLYVEHAHLKAWVCDKEVMGLKRKKVKK